MIREKSKLLTVKSGRPSVKTAYRTVFVALRADLKRYPGGISALAEETGQNPVVLCNKLNPDCHEHAPTAEQLLMVIERGRCPRTAAAIAALAGQTTIELPACDPSPKSVIAAFMNLLVAAGKLTAQGAADLADFELSAAEREGEAALLDLLIPAAVQYRALMRS